MRTYGQYCPIARAAEVLGTRWTLIIVRNLLVGCRTLAEIQDGAPGIPKALLRDRLGQLELLGLVDRRPKAHGRGSQWQLTEAGAALQPVCDSLTRWGTEWLEIGPQHLDPYAVLWSICRVLPAETLPDKRFIVRFEFSDAPVPRLWVLAQSDGAEICIRPPGFEEDLTVHTDSETLLDWHLGAVSLGDAMHAGRFTLEGSLQAQRTLAAWGALARPADTPAAASPSRAARR